MVEGSGEYLNNEVLRNEQAPGLIFCRRDITGKMHIFIRLFEENQILGFSHRNIQEIVNEF